MADFRMPSLGADMDAGTLAAWRVRAGDAVRRGQVIAEVETDKGLIEVEIWEDGVVTELVVGPGTKVPVGTVLARLRGQEPAVEPAVEPTSVRSPPVPLPPSAQAPPAAAAGAALPPEETRVRASPAARRRAREAGLALDALRGTGPGGAITLEDVEAALRGPGPAAARVEPDRMRAAIGAAMARSKREIPHYYLSTTIDLHVAMAWLEAQNRGRSVDERLLPAAVLLRAVARAVRKVPELNGWYQDGALRPSDAVHLGVAVAVRGGGLVAPALFDVETKDVGTVMRELSDLVRRARAGALRSREMAAATLTVTNLGDLGAETVFPVIIPPQVAIVGLGRIVSRPWAVDGMLAVRPVIIATLAADHRVSDGHRGARFLAALEGALQDPEERT